MASDLLLVQSIGDDPDDAFIKYMALQEPIHRAYAAKCGADYEFFVGRKDPLCHPTWNRVRMMIDAFDRGYRKVVWLDADTLVVDHGQDVFAGTSDTAPLLMTRVLSSHDEMPWIQSFNADAQAAGMCGMYREHPSIPDWCWLTPSHSVHQNALGDEWINPQWDVYNDGVLIVNDTAHARACLEWAWENRLTEYRPWHIPGMPELNWLEDYVYENPDAVEQLDGRFNSMGYPQETPREESCIWAWHGHPAGIRWQMYQEAYERFYGI